MSRPRPSLPRALAALLASLWGCGGALPPAPTTEPIDVSAVEDGDRLDAEPEAAPTRPETLVAAIRIRGHARLDASDVAWVKPLARLAKDAASQMPPELLGQIHPDAPIDVAVGSQVRLMRAPKLSPVASVGLRSLESSLAALRGASDSEVTALGDGGYRVTHGHRGQCLLSPSAGLAEARIICARRAAHVERMSRWLVEGIGPQPMPSETDLEATVYGNAVRRAYAAPMLAARAMGPGLVADELRRESPLLADMAQPLLPVLLDEGLALMDDIDELRVQGSGDAARFRVTLDVTLRSANAWTSQTLQTTASEPGSSPVVFWRMPKDAHTAWFVGTRGDHASLEQLRAGFARSSDAALRSLDPSLRALITDSFIPPGTFAYATGFSSEPFMVDPDPGSPAWIRREVIARFGWHIAGLDAPVDRYADYLDQAVDAYNQGPIRNLAYGGIRALCAGMPKITKHPLRRPGMPPGTFEYEMAVPGAYFDQCARSHHPNAAAAKPLRGVIVVIPDGDRTWLGLTLDPPSLYERMEQALKDEVPEPASKANTLIGHAELDWLHGSKPFAGGFVTLGGLAMLESNVESARRGHYVDDHLVVRARSRPDGGMTPIPISWSALGGERPGLRAEAVLPRAAVD